MHVKRICISSYLVIIRKKPTANFGTPIFIVKFNRCNSDRLKNETAVSRDGETAVQRIQICFPTSSRRCLKGKHCASRQPAFETLFANIEAEQKKSRFFR